MTRPTNLNRLSCIGENEYGIEQSRLYQINASEDPSSILIPITLAIFFLVIVFSIVAVVCGCRAKQKRKRSSMSSFDGLSDEISLFDLVKKLPIVYDAHYSINELIKDVGCLRTTELRPCHTSSFHDNDPLSLKIDPTRIEPTGSLI